jgi:hypothetical protein
LLALSFLLLTWFVKLFLAERLPVPESGHEPPPSLSASDQRQRAAGSER